ADVTVTYGMPTCVRQNPTVTLAPVVDHVANGGTAEFTVTVANTDLPRCGTASYDLTASAPLEWTTNVTPASVTTDSGGSAVATLRMTTPTATEVGSFGASVAASNAITGRSGSSPIAAVTVTSDCVLAAPTAVVSPASMTIAQLDNGAFTVTIQNRDAA